MTNVVPYLIVVQALWCILCLPPAGSTSKKGGPKTRKGIGAFKGNDAQGKMADDVQILDKIVVCLFIYYPTPFLAPLSFSARDNSCFLFTFEAEQQGHFIIEVGKCLS